MKPIRLLNLLISCFTIVGLASCGLYAGKPFSNIRMTTDETGKTATTSYTPLQTFCVFADVQGIKDGSVIQARWYVANAEGVAPNTKINTSDYTYKAGTKHIYFKLATWDDSSWPRGSYTVGIFIDGVQVGEQTFAVQ